MPKRDGLRTEFRHKGIESEDGWQQKVLNRVLSKSLATNPNKKRHGNSLYMHVGWRLKELLNIAAQKRGCSKSTYMRRAIAGYLAHDLDMDIAEVLEDGPRPCAWGATGAHESDPQDDAKSYGNWRINDLHN